MHREMFDGGHTLGKQHIADFKSVLNTVTKERMYLATTKLGLIPSPDLPAKLTGAFIDVLPKWLNSQVDDCSTWEPQIVVDPLVGSAEYMNQLMKKAIHLKHKNKWNYVICLTDLPHFMGEQVVVADINIKNKVAVVSIPAFGSFPMKRRLKWVIIKILNDMHNIDQLNTSRVYQKTYKRRLLPSSVKRLNTVHKRITNKQPIDKNYDLNDNQIRQANTDGETNKHKSKDTKTQEDTDSSDIRYIIKSKLLGRLRILVGMSLANRPWSALISFKKILMLAFGTGIYITLFPTPWELSTIYSVPRFILLMFFSIFSMVIWIIFAHKLWEKPSQKGDVRLRKLYNYTTITTLSMIVFINYVVLYGLFLVTIGIFVPPNLFEAGTDLNSDASIQHYFLLAWLITSLGTLAGSIGTASENETKIKQITYSYRQLNRYYEIQDNIDDKCGDKERIQKSKQSKFHQ